MMGVTDCVNDYQNIIPSVGAKINCETLVFNKTKGHPLNVGRNAQFIQNIKIKLQ